jgi:hypothetical protein
MQWRIDYAIDRPNRSNKRLSTERHPENHTKTREHQKTTRTCHLDRYQTTNKEKNLRSFLSRHLTNKLKKVFTRNNLEMVTTNGEYKLKNKLMSTKDKKDPIEKSGI